MTDVLGYIVGFAVIGGFGYFIYTRIKKANDRPDGIPGGGSGGGDGPNEGGDNPRDVFK